MNIRSNYMVTCNAVVSAPSSFRIVFGRMQENWDLIEKTWPSGFLLSSFIVAIVTQVRH